MKKIISGFLLMILLQSSSLNAQSGNLTGKIIDNKTSEVLMGAIISVDNNYKWAASTDIDGNYYIQGITPGPHKVETKYLGYKVNSIDIRILPNETINLTIKLEESSVTLSEAIITTNIVNRDNESSIYIMQKNSTVLQSGISSEEIKRSPDRTSSDVLKRVSGATIQDGRFAIIRGLSDRYNIALVNNTILPSTEPDRKAFAFDVFPSNVLDNILVIKTNQPNLPSEWAGGLIQLNTRDIPEKNFMNVSYSIGFNEGTTLRNFKTYDGSKTDFLGFDYSKRVLGNNFPGILELSNIKLSGNKDSLRSLGKSLINSSWSVQNTIAIPNQSIQMSGGFSKIKRDIKVGGIFSFNYSNSNRFSDGTRKRLDFADKSPYFDYHDEQYNNSISSALMANLGITIREKHKISFKNIVTINSDKTTFLREGASSFSATEQKRTNLEFISSRVINTNLSGQHTLTNSSIKLDWNLGLTDIIRDQPKSIRYSYERLQTTGVNNEPYFFQFSYGGSDPKQSAMFFSNLKERMYTFGTNLKVPFEVWNKTQSISIGYSGNLRSRTFEARNLFIDYPGGQSDSLIYNPNVDEIINTSNFVSKKLTMNPFVFPQDMYRANTSTHAAYIMMENKIKSRFQIVWGFRFEKFNQNLTTPQKLSIQFHEEPDGSLTLLTKPIDTTYRTSYFSGYYKIDSNGNSKLILPILPSVNFIYNLKENMNLRFSYSQSMSRPELREIAPFVYYDFVRDVNLTGSPNLKQTFIHNIDFRYEWFFGRGQIINFGLFYKNFTNTIEVTSIPAGGVQQFIYNNARKANLYGAEVEIKKNLSFIHPKLENLTFSSNLALIYSRVNTKNIKNNSSDEQIRPMQGQSPFLINLGLSYLYTKTSTGATFLYNQSGRRLYLVGEVGNPSWYENSRPVLDLQIFQKFWKQKGTIRLTISDLISSPTFFYQNDVPGKMRGYQSGKDEIVLSQRNFRTYTIQIAFNF